MSAIGLPEWLDPLFDGAEMRAADAWAIEDQGVPSLDLMEHAGLGLARSAAELADGRERAGPIRVVVGRGNNGGDGLVAARLLREEGRAVDVVSVAPPEDLRGDARANLDRLPGDPPLELAPHVLDGSGAIVDCLLGTGFSGVPREPLATAISHVNRAAAPVLACDVPSGVDASTGEVAGEAVRAEITVTFHAPKIGLYVAPGAICAGQVRVAPIGMPRGAPAASGAGLISRRVLGLVPPRPRHGSKFTSGTVIVAGGSRGLTGAPTLAAHAAMRTGAGYVQLAVPASAEAVFESKLTESMTRSLPEEDGSHVREGAAEVVELARRGAAVVLGPGLGRTAGAAEFARELAATLEAPVVIDADGLNAHAGGLHLLTRRSAPTVLTPHAGELGRLLGAGSAEVEAHRLDCARAAAERSGAVVVLKGDDTIVARPGGPVAISPGASPALATAGTGDVLSGVIAAFLAKGLDPFDAAAAGVLGHALAGIEAAHRVGADHAIAGDVIEALPAALSR